MNWTATYGGCTVLYVRDLVREVVAEHAAHELPLVDSLRTLDDDRVVRTLTAGGQKREPLGFGYAEVSALVTPVVWLVLDQAARRTVDRATEGLLARGRAGVRRLLRRAPDTAKHTLIALDPGELALVRTHIVEQATQRGVDRRAAEALADSVVARIATAAAADAEHPETPGTAS
ncbi:hypothetical protein [Streptomyces yunnanensis]|uniref:hypothetical protein n=1 Tax=Streptomyces yunnanensis TaxID=156453 RepID=UPI0025700EB6|nr:hypothetical protein [Streptomyces yunnanensis]